MPRAARIVMPGFPHHVTQKGNNGQEVFFVGDDRRTYLRFLQSLSAKCGLRVIGYCLMTNHVHIIGIPSEAQSLAKAIGQTHLLYTQYINSLHDRTGHLWQNRFYSCPMDESHTWTALSYVEQNPVRAGLVSAAWHYKWSSAAIHCGARSADSRWLDFGAWSRLWTPTQWQDMLRRPGDDAQTTRVRRSTRTGRPLADDAFLSKLEHTLGRRLRPVPLGRPKGIRTTWKRKPR